MPEPSPPALNKIRKKCESILRHFQSYCYPLWRREVQEDRRSMGARTATAQAPRAWPARPLRAAACVLAFGVAL